MKKSIFYLPVCMAMTALAAAAFAQSTAPSTATHPHIKSVTAITEVFGEGQKVTAAAVEYDQTVATAKLAGSAFSVANRTITRVYANTKADKSAQGVNGRFVILELNPTDPGSATFAQRGPRMDGPPGGAAGPGGPPLRAPPAVPVDLRPADLRATCPTAQNVLRLRSP